MQGVWFRASTREQALALGLRGRAVNLGNGDVEVIAAGSSAALDALERWLQHGPPLAQVDRVVRDEVTGAPVNDGFLIG